MGTKTNFTCDCLQSPHDTQWRKTQDLASVYMHLLLCFWCIICLVPRPQYFPLVMCFGSHDTLIYMRSKASQVVLALRSQGSRKLLFHHDNEMLLELNSVTHRHFNRFVISNSYRSKLFFQFSVQRSQSDYMYFKTVCIWTQFITGHNLLAFEQHLIKLVV